MVYFQTTFNLKYFHNVKADITIGFVFMKNVKLSSFDDFLLFRKEIPGLQLTFDCGNAFTGEDPVESLRKSLRHIQNVHIKDWIVSGGTDSPGSCRVSEDTCFRMTLPLSGIVPVREIMAELGNAQYQKNIVMEYIYGDYPVSVQREMISQLKDIFHG